MLSHLDPPLAQHTGHMHDIGIVQLVHDALNRCRWCLSVNGRHDHRLVLDLAEKVLNNFFRVHMVVG